MKLTLLLTLCVVRHVAKRDKLKVLANRINPVDWRQR